MSTPTLFQRAAIAALMCGAGVVGWATPAVALSTNGIQTLKSGTICGFGGRSSNTPYKVRGAGGLPGGGTASSATVQAQGQFGTLPVPTTATFTKAVSVTGTVIGTPETLTVNGVAATVQGTGFSATVTVPAGRNTLIAVATYANGTTQTDQIVVILDVPIEQKVPHGSILVQGKAGDTASNVTVNSTSAVLTAGQFSAAVPVTSGHNTITATAMDVAGNSSQQTIGVFVPTFTTHPAIPTIDPAPAVIDQPSTTLQGTKLPGTTIWINGQPIAGDPQATTWSATVALTEGDNEFIIVTKDANGVFSAEVHVVIVRDEADPVVTFDPPAKTNENPVLLAGTVDDHLVTVTVNGQTATRTGTAFQVSVPLSPGTPGTYPLNLVATSVNNRTTLVNDSIILGVVPDIQTVTPPDGSIVTIGNLVLIQATATDDDPITYRVFLDGQLLGDWASTLAQSWWPSTTQTGLHALQIEARDGYGGMAQEISEVFTVHQPVAHP